MYLALQLAAEDSTGQKITLIVIGLLLAALALAFLTVWYYRVTDPGPSQHKRRGGPPSPSGGPGSSSSRSPSTASWKDRLSGFSLPTLPVRSSKPDVSSAKPSEVGARATAPVSAPGSSPASNAPAPVTKPAAAPSKQTAERASEPPRQSPPAPVQPEAADRAAEKVSLEGGFYLDLTDVSQAAEPPTNVGSLNSLDLRQPAALVDPDREPVPEPVSVPVSNPGASSAANDGTVSFDDWLAEVEATED